MKTYLFIHKCIYCVFVCVRACVRVCVYDPLLEILLEALAAHSSDASTPAGYTCRETHAHAALGTPGCGAGS